MTAGLRLPCQPAPHNAAERQLTAPTPPRRGRWLGRLETEIREWRGLLTHLYFTNYFLKQPTQLLEIDEQRLPRMQCVAEVGRRVLGQGRRAGPPRASSQRQQQESGHARPHGAGAAPGAGGGAKVSPSTGIKRTTYIMTAIKRQQLLPGRLTPAKPTEGALCF